MGDPVDIVANVATGGLYGVGKAAFETVTTGDPMHLLSQGLDLGVAAVGNDLAGAVAGNAGRIGFNVAGAAAGIAGGGLAGLTPAGFGAEGGTAPLATTAAGNVATGGVPLASGVPSSTSVADTAGATLTGPVGAVAPEAAPSATPGGLANMVGAGDTTVATTPLTGLGTGVPVSAAAPETAGYLGEIGSKAGSLNTLDTPSWFSTLSPGAQTALITAGMVGGQTIAGGMSGLFAGVSAQKKLELEKLINQQYQNQLQYQNRNNRYSPLISFDKSLPATGFVNSPQPA